MKISLQKIHKRHSARCNHSRGCEELTTANAVAVCRLSQKYSGAAPTSYILLPDGYRIEMDRESLAALGRLIANRLAE